MTEKEYQTYNAIKDYIWENNYSPSMRELASILNISVASVYYRLSTLKKKGFIDYKKNKSRTIKLGGKND